MMGITLGMDITMFRQVIHVLFLSEIFGEKCMTGPVDFGRFCEFCFSDLRVANIENNLREGHYNFLFRK